MHHGFDVEIAMVVGVNAAIVFDCIYHWCLHNQANGTNYHDGHYWTYNSTKAFQEIFPYWTERQIRTAIDKLKEEEFVLTNKFSTQNKDHTTWYAVTEKAMSVLHKCQFDLTKMSNRSDKNVKSTYIQLITTTNNSIECGNLQKSQIAKIPPTLEEVKKYCLGRKNNVDFEQFFNFYESKGWMVGKSKMKDWKAAVRTWEKRTNQKEEQKQSSINMDDVERLMNPYGI